MQFVDAIERLHKKGIIVYTGEKIRYLSDNVLAVPWIIIL